MQFIEESRPMSNRDRLLDESFDLALQNDMNYFG